VARHEKIITIEDPNSRDHRKRYLIREMPADRGEKWAMRVLNGALKSGASLDDFDPLGGMAALAGFTSGLGIVAAMSIAKMDWELAEPLLDEMMECVVPQSPDGTVTRDRLIAEDTEEIATRLLLRAEVASLHLGFSLVEKFQTWMRTLLTRISSTTPTSPAPSGSSSAEGGPAGLS